MKTIYNVFRLNIFSHQTLLQPIGDVPTYSGITYG